MKGIIYQFKGLVFGVPLEDYLEPFESIRPKFEHQPSAASNEGFYHWERLNGCQADCWAYFGEEYTSTTHRWFKIFDRLVLKEETFNRKVFLHEIERLQSSKSDLRSVSNLDIFAERYCPHWIMFPTRFNFIKLLSHSGIAIINSSTPYEAFVTFSWRKGIGLINSDGSHHLAAARYIGKKLNETYPLMGRMIEYKLSSRAIREIEKDLSIFLVPKNGNFLLTMADFFKEKKINFAYLKTPEVTYIPGNFLILENSLANMNYIDAFKSRGYEEVGDFLMRQYHLDQNPMPYSSDESAYIMPSPKDTECFKEKLIEITHYNHEDNKKGRDV